MFDFSVEGLYRVGSGDGLEFVIHRVAVCYLGMRIVFMNVRQEVESCAGTEGGNDIEDGVTVVVGRPVPSRFGAEEFQSGVDG